MLLHIDISRSSLFVLLNTLKTLGYMEQAEKRGALPSWAAPGRMAQFSARRRCRTLLSGFYQEAARQTWQETLALAVRSGSETLILAQVEGSQQVRAVLAPMGKIPACWPLPPASDRPAYSRSAGQRLSLAPDRRRIELALPICRDGRRPEAALLLSAPAFRWQAANLRDTYLATMRVMAARLSYQLGAPAYTPFQTLNNPSLQTTTALGDKDVKDFLQGPWAARLACVRPDGHPHVIPVWQEWDGKAFSVIAWKGSQWAEYLLQNPSVSLTVDEPWPPFRRVVVRGQAELISPDDPSIHMEELIQRLTRRYLGQANTGLNDKIQHAFRIRPEVLSGRQGMPGPLSGNKIQ